MRPIRFKGSSSVFSNFNPQWIEDKGLGLMFFSVEQGYQHQCALFNGFDNVAEEILSVKPEHDVGQKCKMIAKKITAKHKSWGATKEAILLDLLTLKLHQHEPFRKALLATDRPLLHTVASHYWGLGRHGEGANRCGELLMKLRQSVQSSWGAPHNQVLVYTDSIFKYLPTQIEEVGFCVKALPGASVGGKNNLTPLIHQDLKPGYKPNIVILHVGTNDLAFLERYLQFFHQTINKHVLLVQTINQKLPSAKVIVSLLLPRGDSLEDLRCHYASQLERSLSTANIKIMSWESFPCDYLADDLLPPSDEEGIPFLHWNLLERIRLYSQRSALKKPASKKPAPQKPPTQKPAPTPKPAPQKPAPQKLPTQKPPTQKPATPKPAPQKPPQKPVSSVV